MTRYAFAIDIAAPREHVFDLWTDRDRLAEWTDGLTQVLADPAATGDRKGTKYVLRFGSLDTRVEVVASDRPYYHRTRARFGTITIETSATFEAVEVGTRLRQSYFVRGMKARLWAWLASFGTYRWTFRAELERFARVAEQQYVENETRQPVPVMAVGLPAPADAVGASPPAVPV